MTSLECIYTVYLAIVIAKFTYAQCRPYVVARARPLAARCGYQIWRPPIFGDILESLKVNSLNNFVSRRPK